MLIFLVKLNLQHKNFDESNIASWKHLFNTFMLTRDFALNLFGQLGKLNY